MENSLDEVIEIIFENIHKFLTSKLGDDLREDDIAIDIEKDEKGEIHLSLEVTKKIVDEAISIGKRIADEYCPSLLTEKKSESNIN
ncbi:MAG: hypothetical protein ACTSR2_08415 [Candidatus Hodarchaeales archaeon]